MSEVIKVAGWEKHSEDSASQSNHRISYFLGLALLVAALAYLLVSSNLSGGQYFITVEELQANSSYLGKPVQVVGAVLGPSIEYDVESLRLRFTVAHMPTRTEDLARALFEAANDPSRARLSIQLDGEVMPGQLQDHAQAIISGSLGADGIFYATQLQFKCPTRFGDMPEHEDLLPVG